MNRIHMWYDRTNWRPTRWWWSDHPQRLWQLQEIFMHIKTYPEEPAWLRRDIAEMITGKYRPFLDPLPFYDELPPQVTSWDYCVPHNAAAGEHWQEQENMPHWIEPGHLCKPGTGITAMWQQAVWEGYDPIYFVGIDGNFQAGKPEESHMHPEYYDKMVKTSEAAADGINRTIAWQHTMMEKWSNENGRTIFTVGGAVDAHHRLPLEMVLASRFLASLSSQP